MAEVICGGTERKEPDSVTAGSSPLPALSQDSCHKLRGGSWRKGGKAQTIKACCFFFLRKILVYCYANGNNPQRGKC